MDVMRSHHHDRSHEHKDQRVAQPDGSQGLRAARIEIGHQQAGRGDDQDEPAGHRHDVQPDARGNGKADNRSQPYGAIRQQPQGNDLIGRQEFLAAGFRAGIVRELVSEVGPHLHEN